MIGSKKGYNVFSVNSIISWILVLIFLFVNVAGATPSLQTLKCANSTTVIGNNTDATDFACGSAGVPLKIGLLGNQTGPTQNVRIGTAAFGPWVYAQFINNSEFPSYVNITAYSANISMRMGATAAGKISGFYEIGYYDPNGPQNNFVSLFRSTIANSTTTTQSSYNMSFNGQSGIIPAGDKLMVRVWLNTTNIADRPIFYAYSSTTTGNSSFIINDAPIPTYWISGYIFDNKNGTPISGAMVKTDTNKYARANSGGYYRLPVINGTYQVIANNNSYFINSTSIAIDGSNATNINLSLIPTDSNNWKLVFDPSIDKPSNISTDFTPKVWLYSQDKNPISGQDVTCRYWVVNDNMVFHPCMVIDNFDGSYSSTPLDMTLFRNKYINVLFQVNRGADSNSIKEQHSFYADESSPSHGAVWKIQVLNLSLGPSFNGSRPHKIYMKLISDAGMPFRNNQNTTRYIVNTSSGTIMQSGFMTYEEDGIYSFSTSSNYINGGKYYFEIISNWSGRPTGSTGTGSTAMRNTSAITGFYLMANNTLTDDVSPEILNIKRKPYFPVDDDIVTVTVDAVDNVDIISAYLHYSVNQRDNYILPMIKQNNLEYSTQIPAYLLEDNVRYRVNVSDGTGTATSEEFKYNVQDRRGNANMSHSFLSHPVYWFGKSRQANFHDRGGDTNYDGIYSTSEIDRVAYLSTPPDYLYFKDMTRIKVQTLIMDETGKPIQHLTNVKAWLSNNSVQSPGTHNREKVMTEVTGEAGVYTATWEGSPNVSGTNLVWNEDAISIWGNYTSGEIYSVFVDANNDSIPEENITWLAYNFGDTLWGGTTTGINRDFGPGGTVTAHNDLETPGATCGSYGSCHMMVRDLANRSYPGATCPDCHGVYKSANNSIWPISGNTNVTNEILYGNSTAHPRLNKTNAATCGDETCHNWDGTTRFPTSNAYMEIPGYEYGTRINGTFRSTYPNPMQCAEHHDYKEAKIPLEEGHNKMVGCKYCHGGSHSNFKLQDYNISAMGTISTIEKGTPGYVGTGGTGGSGTYAGDCYKDCHRVQVEHSLTGKPGGATQNAFVPCDECHQDFNNAPMHQESLFPYPDREWCGSCHQVQGNITSHNTSNPLNPPRIPSTQLHAQESGTRWNNTGVRPYWVENEQSCRFCHGRSYNEEYGLGKVRSFQGTNTINGSINSTSYWCSSCHVNTSSQNYNNMVNIYNYSFGAVPPEITGSTWRSNRGGYFDHDQSNTINISDPATYNDEICFSCHGGSLLQLVGLDTFIHNVSQSRAGPDCISCHNTGGNASKHINFSAMARPQVVHNNLNSNASSGGLSDENKKCWACHGIVVNGYANMSDQPQDTHPENWNPKKCPDCHTTGIFNASGITDHISSGYTAGTDLFTRSYCSSCHNNSVYSVIEGSGSINASVSHYVLKTSMDSIGSMNTSEGCIYCHYDPVNAASWGNASDPRTSNKRQHTETRNSQCTGCHISGTVPPTTLHNETLFARISGGTAPQVPSGSSKILVATNRYVVLDDWSTAASLGTGFSLPGATHTSQDSWTAINTKINATALFMDDSGMPLNGKIITFNLYMPNGTEFTPARINATTDEYGLADFSFDMNARNYYGNWTVKASNNDLNDSTNFIYNWWGCGIGTCSSGHSNRDPANGGAINSPYMSGRDATVNSNSNHRSTGLNCTNCHQSFDGKPGANAVGGVNHLNNPSDVHRNITCDNANCHQTLTAHQTNAVISSCYNTNCHTPSNRPDISNKSTLSGILSIYSWDNGSAFNSTFHTPNSTVPCFICHGPMHNITKPDGSTRFIKNMDTESGHCTTCHANSSHSQNNAVGCTLCHGSDAHAPAYLTNQTTATVANYSKDRSSAAGCKDCHNNTGVNSYFSGKGYAPMKNDSYGYNLTDHNNFVSCNTCHDRLHWTGYLNSTGQYQKSSTGSIECLDCHSGTNSNVSNSNAYWGYVIPSKVMHNNSVSCETCHFASKHGIRFLQTDMVSSGSKNSSATCVNCHQQGYPGAPLIPAPVNHSTNTISGALWNATQRSFWDNTSQLSSCNYCHGAELHSASALGEIEKVKGSNNNNQSLTNGYWCANCHYKNAPDYAGDQFSIQPPEVLNLFGLVPTISRDGTSFFNHSNDLSSGYDDAKCKTCHNNDLPAGSTSLNFTHNVGVGSSGGNNCIACHNISSPGSNPKVNFNAINSSVHGNLNAQASSSLELIPNKPCWGCHGTVNGTYANESDQPQSGHNTSVYRYPRKCETCHITGQIMFSANNVTDHISSGLTFETDVNTSSYNPGYCSSCHNNSVKNGFEPDSMGISGGSPVNASVSHYGANKTGNMLMAEGINSTECIFCHRNSTNMPAWGILPGTRSNISNKNATNGGTDHSAFTSSSQCSACHGGYSITSEFTFHDGALGNGSGGAGGPDCKMCHNINSAQKNVNFSAMNQTDSIHKDLNNEAFSSDNAFNESKKCWACHGNGSQPQGHPEQYKTPSKCIGCHTNSSSQFPGLQVSRHYWNNSDIRTPAANSCYICHNVTEMIIPAFDPDGNGSVYAGENGGNDSVSHYGRKRPDYQSIQGTNEYCARCHNNASSVFPFIDAGNKTIANHSVNYPASNPDCADCHSTGRLHDSTLSNPKFSLPNSSFCITCHGPSGSAALKDKEKHNGSVECTQCHMNSSRSIHPVQYLQQDTASWDTSKTNAINCTDCHRSGFANATVIPDPIKHSNNLSNGSLWNNTAYWTTGSGSCNYCHNNTNHNSTAIGKISILLSNPDNSKKGQLTTTTWCADCHYNDPANVNYKGDQWYPVPPLITVNNTNKNGWINHSSYFVSGYSDSSCETCHYLNGNSSKDSMNYSHSLDAGIGGGPDCISCHDIAGLAPKTVNVTDLGKGIHKNLNGADADPNRSCYACHGDGNAPASGHPVEYKTPKKCDECHSQGNYSALVIQGHKPPKVAKAPGSTISTNAYCTVCHNNSINNFAYTINGSVSHYGTNTTILRPTVNQSELPVLGFFNATDAQDHNKECNNCHKNYPFNLTYGNAIRIETGHTSTGACVQCHLKESGSNLHNSSVILPQTFDCLECHTSNASKYNAPNITGTIMATYPTATCEINGCHGQGAANGLLDTVDKHNINVEFSGTAGNTGQVYLNGQNSITVSNGTQVLITSMINDFSGGGYYSSRVRGAEYYIDIDPGIAKGIVLNASDGLYDAVDGSWENVFATIDTTNLSVGTHTIFVRGMDIGKQWSLEQNATLIIKSNDPYIPPTPDILFSTQGNFWINQTWSAGIGNVTESFNVSVNGSWTNGTNINYSNISVDPHGWSNISVFAFNNSGNGSLSLAGVSNNTQIANNNPVIAPIGNKIVAEGRSLTFTISATDIDQDLLVNGTNATKGSLDPVTGQFNWTPGYGDQGIYFWKFNTSDNYSATTDQTITVTVNNVPLSITASTPVTDPTSTESATQVFSINLNRTSNVTWYVNDTIISTNTSVNSSIYTNSTAGIGVYNVTAIANDGFDSVIRTWNWTVTAIPTYQVSGYVFDNFGTGTENVTVQNETHIDATSASGQYSLTGLLNGTYNFSFSKPGFNTDYLELTINGAHITNANITIFDTSAPGQVAGLLNDTPGLASINLTWDPVSEVNYYQVFRNSSSIGYTRNTFWNDTGLNSSTIYEYMIRANDTYDNWGQNSTILYVVTATPDTSPPASISILNMTTGNFFINNTWINPVDPDLDHIWFRYSNGTTLQNVSKPVNYMNISYSVRYTQNISAQSVDSQGNTNQTQIWFNTTIPNNPPIQLPIGSKSITENQLLQINVTSTDVDSDTIIYGTNATKGTFNISTGRFSWRPSLGESGVYIWYFNSSDNYGGVAIETITVTVNGDPLANCLLCHNTTQGGNPAIIQSSFGKHMNVNTEGGNGILNNGDCIICHYDFSNMLQGGFTTLTKECIDCHAQGNLSAPIISNHRNGGVNITTAAYCSICHNNSIREYSFNVNTSVAHYSTNASLLKPTVNNTILPVFGFMYPAETLQFNKECNNCHNPSNSSYGNATQINYGHTSTGTCNQCHLNDAARNLHNGSLIKPVTSSCIGCHTTYADTYNAPNLTNTTHGGYDCSYTCHVPTDFGTKGIFGPEDHNTNWRFSPGNPPITNTVFLNGATSLTVQAGTIVTITSNISDRVYSASKVRGAQYYIDTDPGIANGNYMNAVDGKFDAVNGAPEEIIGTLDTSGLNISTHTIYVRGMDIGKQWSPSISATLTVLESRGFINGTVMNATGSGIQGAKVMTGTGVNADSDSTGNYSLYLTIGTYNLTATKIPEYYSNISIQSVNVTGFNTSIQNIIMDKKPTGTINGTVRS